MLDEGKDSESALVVTKTLTGSEKDILRKFKRRWTIQQKEVQANQRAEEFHSSLKESTQQMRTREFRVGCLPANRYGEDAWLPKFDPAQHVPLVALINPFAGAMVGADILEIARKSPYYQDRFFNIIDVCKDQRRGGLLDILRIELCKAKEEAKSLGVRPRLISGGGDGTASFALHMIFAALRADDSRADDGLADVGNGFIWTDEELAEYFPAIAQMPLGSANDFAHTLGWGDKYPGCRACCLQLNWRKHALGALQSWLEAVLKPSSRVVNFDIYGMVPEEGADACDFKLAELTGPRGLSPQVMVAGEKQILMKEAGHPVPLFTCLYFSAGFGAYMTARFQMNRRKGPIRNKMEYAKQAAGILLESIPPQLNVGLDGVQITAGGQHYFPPRSENGQGGRRYREVGFLNINWQAGMLNGRERASVFDRLFTSREPAKFNDGRMDMYRGKFRSLLRNPGLKYQTDKRNEGLTLTYSGGKGKGVFFQWDGESRFAFSPLGQPFHIHIRKILSIPVVLGPQYNAKITGNADNGQKVIFRFGGDTPKEQQRFRERIVKGVKGELNAELIASKDELLTAGFPMGAS